jgi:hypothetical protein
LADTPLGQYLTARSRSAVPNPQDLIIKVVSDKDVYKQLPELRGKAPAHAPAGVGRGYGWCSYRTKCILGFRRFRSTGSQVVFLGMYVHEYDRQCPGPNAGRAMIECLDSTPLYSEERPGERQDILTNIMLAYFEFITAAGFEYAHIRVPPPTDDKGYIFASRSVNVRLRAAMHLAHWFKRLLQTAESKGVIHSFSAGADSGMNDFPASLLEPAQLASDIAFRCATGQSMQQQPGAEASGAEGAMEGLSEVFRAAPLKDRFFVIRLAQTEAGRGAGQSGVNLPRGLDPEKVQRLTWQAMLPSYIAGDRFELVALLQREGLHFHSLAHNNYSTMMLVHHLMEEQRMMVCDGNYHQRYGDRGVSGTGGVALQHLSPMHAHAHHDSFSQHVYQRAQMQRMEVSREMMAGHAAHLGYVEGTAGRGHATGRMPFDVVCVPFPPDAAVECYVYCLASSRAFAPASAACGCVQKLLPAAVFKSCVHGAHASPAVAILFRLFSYISLTGMACLVNQCVLGRSFDGVTMSGISVAFRALMLLLSSFICAPRVLALSSRCMGVFRWRHHRGMPGGTRRREASTGSIIQERRRTGAEVVLQLAAVAGRVRQAT